MRIVLQTLRGLLTALLVGFLAAPPALADPALQEVVRGEVSVEQVAMPSEGYESQFNVMASDGSIANYSSFDIPSNQLVNVRIAVDGGSHLARVISVDPTEIAGHLWSNGHVYLVNPAGVYFRAGASVDVVGLHAAAGKIDESSFRDFSISGGVGEIRYFDLEGTVENMGTINAAVVDLVGRHVVNGGTISSADDGFFVLVVGDDVTIVHETGPDGEFEVSVTIQGLAGEVLDEVGAPLPVGIETLSGSSIEAGEGGQIVMALGAGDLIGAAIRHAGRAEAGEVVLAAEGADVEVDGAITGDRIELCAGSACFDSGGLLTLDDSPSRESGAVDELRARVAVGSGAELTGGSLRVQQDGDLVVRAGIGPDEGGIASEALVDPGLAVELITNDGAAIEGDVTSASFTVRAGIDGTGDLELADVSIHTDEVALVAGDSVRTRGTLSPSEVRIDPAASFRASEGDGAPQSFSVIQDASISAASVAAASQFGDVAPGETMAYELRTDEGEVTVDDAIAAKLVDDPRSADWDLAIQSAGDLSVGSDLRAASLNLRAGAQLGQSASLSVGPVGLLADQIELHSGNLGASDSSILLDQGTVLANTAGSGAPESLVLRQDAEITQDVLLHPALRLEAGEVLALTLQSDGRLVSLDLDSLEGEAYSDAVALLRQTDLTLKNEEFPLSSDIGIEVTGDLQTRSLFVSAPNDARFSGNVSTTDGDLTLVGNVVLAGEGDQTLRARRGEAESASIVLERLVSVSTLEKASDGDLILDAEDGADLDGNLRVVGGSLEVLGDLSITRDITVLAARDEDGVPVADSGRFEITGYAFFDGALDQTVEARVLRIGERGQVQKTSPGSLLLRGTDSVSVVGSARGAAGDTLEISSDGVLDVESGAWLGAFELELDGSRVELRDGAALEVTGLQLRQSDALTGADVQRAVTLAWLAQRISIESTGSQLTVDRALGTGAELTLRSAQQLSIQDEIRASTLTLQADTAAGEAGILEVGTQDAPVALFADEIVLQDGEWSIALADDTRFAGFSQAEPIRLTLRQEAAVDTASFSAATGSAASTLILWSDAGDVVLAEDFVSLGEELVLIAAGDVSIEAGVQVEVLRAHGGTDGEGEVRLGIPDDPADPLAFTVTADTVELVAGDAAGSADERVRIGAGVEFEGLASFKLEQDADIQASRDLPDLAGFNGALWLQSNLGTLLVDTAQGVVGTDLTLASHDRLTVDVGDGASELILRSLRVNDLGSGAGTELHQSVTADGDIELAGDVELISSAGAPEAHLRSEAGEVRVDGELVLESSQLGAVLRVEAERITLRDVSTLGATDLGEPIDDGLAAPSIVLVGDQVTLTGILSAGDGEDIEGDISVTAGTVAIGRAEPGLLESERVVLKGRDVTLTGDVVRTRVEDGGVDRTDELLRELRISSTGALTANGSIDVSSLDFEAFDQITLAGDVTTHDVELSTGTAPGSIRLEAGRDGTGDLVVQGQRLAASEISLRAGVGTGDAEILLGDARLLGVDGLDAPDEVTFAHDPSLTPLDVHALVGRLGDPSLGAAAVEGTQLVLVSQTGSVELDGGDVQGSRLGLVASAENADGHGIVIHGDLDVQELDLFSSALVDGDLAVRFFGLGVESDLTVLGDMNLTTDARFTGEETQTLDVQGSLTAPILVAPSTSDPRDLVVRAGGDIRLPGAVSLLDSRIESANIREGGVLFETDGDLYLGGDVNALGDIVLDARDVLFVGVEDQRVLSEAGTLVADVTLSKTDAQYGRRLQDRSLTLGGGAGYDVDGDIAAAHDLTLVGPGVLRGGDSEERTLSAQDGRLVLVPGSAGEEEPARGGVDASAVAGLTLEAGEDIVIDGTGEVEDEILLVADQITFAAPLRGTGSLTADVTGGGEAGTILLTGDALLESSSTLTLKSDALSGIAFDARGAAQTIQAGSIVLNPQGHSEGASPTVGASGDLALVASDGNVELGRGEILTVLGELQIDATGKASLGQLNALGIDLRAGLIVANEAGVDWNANYVWASGPPLGAPVVGTPSTTELSDVLVNEQVLLLALREDLTPLTRADLVADGQLLDVTPVGAPRFEAARQMETPIVQVESLPLQVLGQYNRVAAERRPLLADELIAFLESASLGGERASEPALAGERFDTPELATVLGSYRGLFAPTQRFDRATGGQISHSHRPRIRAALGSAIEAFRSTGAPFTGAAFAHYLETRGRYGEALFYLSTLRDIVEVALQAGLDRDQVDQFRRLLLRGIVPEGVPAELLVETLGS